MNTISFGAYTRTTLSQTALRLNSNLNTINARLLRLQTQLATGQRINTPSDDPFGTVVALQLQTMLEKKDQYLENVRLASNVLATTDSALADILDIINEARVTGQAEIGAVGDDATRAAAAVIIDSLINELIAKANTQYNGRSVFGGDAGETNPFAMVGTAIGFIGNNNSLYTRTDENTSIVYNVTSDTVFATEDGMISGFADLDPNIDLDTDVRVLNGGGGIDLGSIDISDDGGTTVYTADLSGVQTIGDVIDAINAATAASGNITCALNAAGDGLEIVTTRPGGDLTVLEVGNHHTAADLGIFDDVGAGTTLTGDDLDPELSLRTPVSLLAGGAGIDLTSGIAVRNGPDHVATITFGSCTTVEDILNEINSSGLHVEARIAEDGNSIEVISLLHGTELRIGEVAAGTTATDLGIRTMAMTTEIASLNGGSEVRTVTGDDFRITCRNGDTIDVDVSNMQTVGDVIDAINNDVENAGRVLARLAEDGNGIEMVDSTGDLGFTFEVTQLSDSYAAADLGILQSAGPGGDTITGDDVNGIRHESVFAHLLDLRDALVAGDSYAINVAVERLAADHADVLKGRAEAGSKGKRMEVIRGRIDQEILESRSLLSETMDLNFAEAVIEYTTMEAALQATLKTSASILGLSLLDFMD